MQEKLKETIHFLYEPNSTFHFVLSMLSQQPRLNIQCEVLLGYMLI